MTLSWYTRNYHTNTIVFTATIMYMYLGPKRFTAGQGKTQQKGEFKQPTQHYLAGYQLLSHWLRQHLMQKIVGFLSFMFEKNSLFRHFGCKKLQVPGESVHVESVQDAHHNNRHQSYAEITIQYNLPQPSRDVREMRIEFEREVQSCGRNDLSTNWRKSDTVALRNKVDKNCALFNCEESNTTTALWLREHIHEQS